MRRLAGLALALAAVAGDTDVEALIAKLGHAEAAVREAASAALEKKGRDAVAPLKAALEKAEHPEVRGRIEALLDTLDWPDPGVAHNGMRLTLRLEAKELKPGGLLVGKVRLASESDKRVRMRVATEQPPGADGLARVVRLVAVDAAGRHRALGAFQNFNRGPDAVGLAVPPKSVQTVEVSAVAGSHLFKGARSEHLPPGAYSVYAVLGDVLGGWDRVQAPPLRSNEVRIRIAAPDDDE